MEPDELIGNVVMILGALLVVALLAGALTLRSGVCPPIPRTVLTNASAQCHVSTNR
jgi:hypothetical protein